MSPCHVLPLRTVGVPLVVEVPHTTASIIKHTIRVVHPSVLRGMVIDGTEVLAVGGVERGGILHLAPANKLSHSTLLATVTVKLDV